MFLIERWEVPVAEAPDEIAMIGADPESQGNYLQHYFDSRGVARLFKMSFEDGAPEALARGAGLLIPRLLPLLTMLASLQTAAVRSNRFWPV